jgi:hypothetical protein
VAETTNGGETAQDARGNGTSAEPARSEPQPVGWFVWTDAGYAFKNKLHATREDAERARDGVVWHNRHHFTVQPVYVGSEVERLTAERDRLRAAGNRMRGALATIVQYAEGVYPSDQLADIASLARRAQYAPPPDAAKPEKPELPACTFPLGCYGPPSRCRASGRCVAAAEEGQPGATKPVRVVACPDQVHSCSRSGCGKPAPEGDQP